MDPQAKLIAATTLILCSMSAGYGARKLRLLGDHTAKLLMTFVMVIGYSSVQLLAIWQTKLSADLVWLPVVGGLNMTVMLLVGVALAGLFTKERPFKGLFAISSGAANTGVTMGGLILLALYGERGLELMSIYCIMWMLVIVFVMYPIARHYSPDHTGGSLGKLMLHSIFDWRSIALPMALVGLGLNLGKVAQPVIIKEWGLLTTLTAVTNAAAYFAIGLRLKLGSLKGLWRLIGGIALMRFVVSGLLAAGTVWLFGLVVTDLSWELRRLLIIESLMPVGVATVAIANMFQLRPGSASVMFLVNTLGFLLIVLPVLFWVFRALG